MDSFTDCFDDCSSSISVLGDESTTIAKNVDNSWATAYGSEWIRLNDTESIIEYRVKVNKLSHPSEGLMFIGISSTNQHSNGKYSFYNDNKNFAYRSDGVFYHNSKYFGSTNEGYASNDIITLTINPFTRLISFYKNSNLVVSQKYNTRSTNSYKLAISLFNLHDSVSIINQTETVSSCNIISDLVDHNNVLNDEITRLKEQMSSLRQFSRDLQFENDSLRKQNHLLTTTVVSEEQHYINWNMRQVLSWIMSIKNGVYLKYYEMLNVKLADWSFNGKKLKDLDYVDVKEQLGIIDVDDRKLLYRQIQLLIAKNKGREAAGSIQIEGCQSLKAKSICDMCSNIIKT